MKTEKKMRSLVLVINTFVWVCIRKRSNSLSGRKIFLFLENTYIFHTKLIFKDLFKISSLLRENKAKVIYDVHPAAPLKVNFEFNLNIVVNFTSIKITSHLSKTARADQHQSS